MYFLICGKIDVKGKMTRADKKKAGRGGVAPPDCSDTSSDVTSSLKLTA